MSLIRNGMFALAFACAGLTASAFAAPAQPGASGYALTDSSQTYVLTAGTPQYDAWAKWIKEHDELSKKADGATWASGQVGQITITTTLAHQPASSQIGAFDSPPDNGPPSPLPATGTPGQQIRIVNQTPTVYQSWTYVWVVSSGGGGGWSESSYSGNSCSAGHETGKLCPASPNL